MKHDDDYSPTQREFEILQVICKYGGLTAIQIAHLLDYNFYYDKGDLAPARACGKLILNLRKNELLHMSMRKPVMGSGRKAFFYTLTPAGKRVLARLLGEKISGLGCRKPDDNTEHFILMTDFHVNLLRATRGLGPSVQIVQSDEEAVLRVRHATAPVSISFENSRLWPQDRILKDTTVLPDYYFHLRVMEPEVGNYRRFVEIDRGTEALKTVEEKLRKYREYLGVGGQAERPDQYGTHSIVVLIVMSNDVRLEHTKQIVEDFGGRSRFWFSTHNRLNAVTFFTENAWKVAGKKGWCGFFGNPKEMESIYES